MNTNGSFRRAVRNHLKQKFDNLVGVHGPELMLTRDL
jgi:hypothetical protein